MVILAAGIDILEVRRAARKTVNSVSNAPEANEINSVPPWIATT